MTESSEFYKLLLRPTEASASSASLEEIRSKLLRIPTVEETERRRFEFGEASDSGIMTLELMAEESPDGDRLDRVNITLPRNWLPARGPQVFALVFMTAEWLGWEVYDPQIDDTLKKDVVLQGMVAMRRAQLDREGES